MGRQSRENNSTKTAVKLRWGRTYEEKEAENLPASDLD